MNPALRTRTFEPDAPHFTPRISGMLTFSPEYAYKLSILKSGDAEGKTTLRQTFDTEPLAGTGHFIHTYQGDGAVLPSFSGEPVAVAIPKRVFGVCGRSLECAERGEQGFALCAIYRSRDKRVRRPNL